MSAEHSKNAREPGSARQQAIRLIQRLLARLRPGVPAARCDPAAHYLTHEADAELNPEPRFDSAWYLAAYPDVAAAGMNPLVHFLRHGRAEGRLPQPNRALAWEHHLWRGAGSVMLTRLEHLLADEAATPDECSHARWALARWHAWQGQWQAVAELLLADGLKVDMPHPGPALLAVEALCRLGLAGCPSPSHARASPCKSLGVQEAMHQVLTELKECFPERADTHLAEANVLGVQPGSDQARLDRINRMLSQHGLCEVALREKRMPLGLDNLAAMIPAIRSAERDSCQKGGITLLVSVIVPLFNAEATVATALRSLFAQTWRPLEIIVVDDASQDGSVAVVERLAEECPAGMTLRILRHATNQGAYAARNTGLAASQGEFITTHDSDDWSHPEKVERQARALVADEHIAASLSHWVRVTPELLFHRWRLDEYGWVYPNISSLLVRRSVIETLGVWDNVTVNADTEYRERIEAAYGSQALSEVLPGIPLALGRADEGSLSQHSATHLVTQFAGVRRDYMASARRWHQAAKIPRDLRVSEGARSRPFVAPAAICRHAKPAAYQHPLDQIQASGLFDPGWYLRTHIDLQQAIIEPLEHYWQTGAAEGRDPGPHFSVSGYRRQYPDAAEREENPLLHFLETGQAEGRDPWPIFPGTQEHREGSPTVLLCGHQAGESLYGAERSLQDLLEAFHALGWNTVVALPSAVNGRYLSNLQSRALAVAVLPYGWWQQGKAPEPATVRHFEHLIRHFAVDAVHANTLVLDEPLHAARQSGVPAIVHVRELPAHDAALRETLGTDAHTIGRRVLAVADLVIANSQCVADFFTELASPLDTPPLIQVVPNTADMQALQAIPSLVTGNAVTVGMLSSNQPKKGLTDLEKVAERLLSLAPDVKVAIVGPRTAALVRLFERQDRGLAPRNLHYLGYVREPAEALGQLDIVLNLSRFQESFGRTVLEAMAAARPVVAYAWGALPELVDTDKTGFLVPFGDIEAVARQITQLASCSAMRRAMGESGRQRAQQSFSQSAMTLALQSAYARIGLGDSCSSQGTGNRP